MIEKRITEAMLEAGEVRLSAREAIELELPEHSTTVALELEGDTFAAQWAAAGRYLHGEVLLERLQDYGQVNGLLRLRATDHRLHLQLLPPGTTRLSAPSGRLFDLPPPTPDTSGSRRERTDPPRRVQTRKQTSDRTFHPDAAYDWGRTTQPRIGFLTDARNELVAQIKGGGFDTRELVRLRVRGEELATLDDFEELLAVDVSNVDRMPHQEAVARQVLSKMRGRAVLADEVGLGKTIEAGLVAKELALRGLARRMLVICPAPLRDQWRDEMAHKFELSFDVATSSADVGGSDHQIMSLDLARRNLSRLAEPFDLVIIDEAHKVAGANAPRTRQLITELSTTARFVLFLTATPVQNDLMELYRLVQLLRPGTFNSASEFRRTFMHSDNPREPANPADLRRLVSSAMVRTTRAQAGVDRVTRRARDVPIRLGKREQELYVLSTHLLRGVMTEPADTMRRRSLALRLSANPFSMGTTALRMAEAHPNRRVADTLREIGHLAMDIRGSARETRALEISRQWLDEHGRVLVFTQHTDTVTALLRRYETEGIVAVPFHGGLSAQQKGKSISEFKSGRAPIMVSTDAGAEGQNLQFCNCVLNYDLPWNPMRIEQRIGRVDRLTQPRDEVFIANLYARGTIDESVYQLLADKLRMFELLFGQVTTILGELDEGKTATFEGRVLEALFAGDDERMNRLLTSLGTELAEARERAADLISADSGLSRWLRTDHRAGLTKSGATELAPEVEQRTRQRQAAVQQWTRDVIKALGGSVIHDTGSERGAFLTVLMPDALADVVGGRRSLHLAFDRHGLEHHPDAELCAVGSPVFQELLSMLRQRGDVNVTVPTPPEPGPTPLRASDSIELLNRRFAPIGEWRGRATFRALIGEGEPQEQLLTVEVGNPGENETLERRELTDGEGLPHVFGAPRALVRQFEDTAREELESRRRAMTRQLDQQRREELERIEHGYNAQLHEAKRDDRERLQRALNAERRRLDRDPDVRARAELLAIELDEADWVIEEHWQHRTGAEGYLTYRWNHGMKPIVTSDASGEPIEVLSLCSDGHWVEAGASQTCSSCDNDRCDACKAKGIFAPCHLCFESTCGACRRETGGLCRHCGQPSRLAERDTEHARAWRLHDGRVLLVSASACIISGTASPIVPDADVDDPDRIRVRAYATAVGLPPDTGLLVRNVDAPAEHDTRELIVLSEERLEVGITNSPTGGNSLYASGVEHLPDANDVDTLSERGAGLAKLLARLRTQAPPPEPPALIVTKRTVVDELVLTPEALIRRTRAVSPAGEIETVRELAADLIWTTGDPTTGLIASASLVDAHVDIERMNRGLTVSIAADGATTTWAACPTDTRLDVEHACASLLAEAGAPGGVIAAPVAPVPTTVLRDDLHPTECRLVDRTTEVVAEVVEASDKSLRPIVADDLEHVADVKRRSTRRLTGEIAEQLLARAHTEPTHTLDRQLRLTERWSGFAVAHRVVTTRTGSVPPVNDSYDRGELLDFGVCRAAHFYRAGSSAQCVSCWETVCPACSGGGEPVQPCDSCGTAVCHRCRESTHVVSAAVCRLCDRAACAECGHDPEVQACQLCGRDCCASCRVDELCLTCASLTRAAPEDLEELPTALAAAGMTAWVSASDRGSVIVLASTTRLELAIVRGDQIEDWVSYRQDPESDEYRLSLAVSRVLGTPVDVVAVETASPDDELRPHLLLSSQLGLRACLEVADATTEWAGEETRSSAGPQLFTDVARMLDTTFDVPRYNPNPPPALIKVVSGPVTEPWPGEWGWRFAGTEIALTADGLIERRFLGREVSVVEYPWTASTSEPQWWSAAWEPAPIHRWHAQTSGHEASIGTFGQMLVIGIKVGAEVTWASIRANADAQAASALALLGDVREADLVMLSTTPAQVVRTEISNASDVSISVLPIIETVDESVNPTDPAAVLQAWNPTMQLQHPPLIELPISFAAQLDSRFPAPARVRVAVGASVVETTHLTTGATDVHQLTLAPGVLSALRLDATTGEPCHRGWIDRDGHFSSSVLDCAYCHELACRSCSHPPTSCALCGIELCARCAFGDQLGRHLCPACATLTRPTRADARKLGRMISSRRLLVGRDAVHEVAFERTKIGGTCTAVTPGPP